MRSILKKENRLKETIFLLLLSLFCIGALLFRIKITQTGLFLFLIWNLFLAFLPWAFSSLVFLKPKFQKSKIIVFIVLFLWLLFFPNAPYIFTDLFHLRRHASIPMWYDLVLILSFAWTGLLFGFFKPFRYRNYSN